MTLRCRSKGLLLATQKTAQAQRGYSSISGAFEGQSRASRSVGTPFGQTLTPSPRSRIPGKKRGLSALRRRKKNKSNKHPLQRARIVVAVIKNNCRNPETLDWIVP